MPEKDRNGGAFSGARSASESKVNRKSPGTNVSLNRRRRLKKNETQGRAPATPKNDKSLGTRLQQAKSQTREGQLRVFAGETHEEALARKNAGNRGVRPEQVAISQGGAKGGITVGAGLATQQGPRNRKTTRGGLAIN